MADLKNTDGLIIDVRDNTGGNLSEMRLSSYFHSDKQVAVALLARHYLKALGLPVTNVRVEWTRADLCFVHDPDIEKALTILSGKTR